MNFIEETLRAGRLSAAPHSPGQIDCVRLVFLKVPSACRYVTVGISVLRAWKGPERLEMELPVDLQQTGWLTSRKVSCCWCFQSADLTHNVNLHLNGKHSVITGRFFTFS